MGVLSFLKRKNSAPPAPPGGEVDRDSVKQARVRARRRLIGALVLLTAGVVGFPLLFEAQPRPVPVDIPLDIPSKDSATPLAVPGLHPSGPIVRRIEPVPQQMVTETQAEAGREVALPSTAPMAMPPRAAAASTSASASAPGIKAPLPRPAPPVPATHAHDQARTMPAVPEAKAHVETPASSASTTARYVLQIGAYAEPAAAREVRLQVEKLGLKTYTQAIDTPMGKRIRVRVGPFAARPEADKIAARLRSAGLAPAVLTL